MPGPPDEFWNDVVTSSLPCPASTSAAMVNAARALLPSTTCLVNVIGESGSGGKFGAHAAMPRAPTTTTAAVFPNLNFMLFLPIP